MKHVKKKACLTAQVMIIQLILEILKYSKKPRSYIHLGGDKYDQKHICCRVCCGAVKIRFTHRMYHRRFNIFLPKIHISFIQATNNWAVINNTHNIFVSRLVLALQNRGVVISFIIKI